MLKFVGINNENGKKTIRVGLTQKNWENLLQQKNIVIDGNTLGFPELEISLFGAEDNNSLLVTLKAQEPVIESA